MQVSWRASRWFYLYNVNDVSSHYVFRYRGEGDNVVLSYLSFIMAFGTWQASHQTNPAFKTQVQVMYPNTSESLVL